MLTRYEFNEFKKRKRLQREVPWSSLPQDKKEKKLMDVLTNGIPKKMSIEDEVERYGGEAYAIRIGLIRVPTMEEQIRTKIQTFLDEETPIERIIRIKKRKVKWYDGFRKGYSNV
jgi:hypothetical protein